MDSFDDKLKDLAKELFVINAIKFGEYVTKVGLKTPVYLDLRVIVSYPKIMETLSDLLKTYLENIKYEYDLLCGVPYTALPIATVISLKTSIPMVMRRKEAKDYGTKKLIEGFFEKGQNCLIIEDVVSSGSSIWETVKDLVGAGIKCTDALVLLDREQGGSEFLKNNGIQLHSLLSMTQLMRYLKESQCVDDTMVTIVKKYVADTQLINQTQLMKMMTTDRLSLSFQSRAKLAKNLVSRELFQIMSTKNTTLCVAADLTSSSELLNLAEEVGPQICILKTHIDIIEDFHPNLIKPLIEIAHRHHFLLMEDRKFSDIGRTVENQYCSGAFQISSWANLVTAHSLMGKGVLDALKSCAGMEKRGVFLLAEASSAGNLIDGSYVKATLAMADEYPELIAGVVQLTPGVRTNARSDALGQQYDSTEGVVLERGADVAVVGRGITKAADRGVAAAEYKKLLWDAYMRRVKEV